ncbi:MAG: hypothetical protein VKJ46_00055 [Leptolyngbyaceae bacterium]|nr:hypothetical protein [Leptolyngbyaceae bacterium]
MPSLRATSATLSWKAWHLENSCYVKDVMGKGIGSKIGYKAETGYKQRHI